MTSHHWSSIVRYTVVSAINLAILLVGIALGILIAPHLEKTVNANPIQSQSTPQISKPTDDPQVDYVNPTVTFGPAATSVLLANRIACDRLQVNGFDTLKLNDAILSLLARKGVATQTEIEAVVAAGKADRPIRVRPAQ